MSLRNKIFFIFFVMVLLDVLVGFGIDTSIRQAGRQIQQMSDAGRRIWGAREIANGVLEEDYLLLLAVSPGQDSARARELVRDRHDRILGQIDRHWGGSEDRGGLKNRYMEYWGETELYLAENPSGLDRTDLESFYRWHILRAAGDTEKTVKYLAGEDVERLNILRNRTGWHETIFRLLRLPENYIRAVNEYGRVYTESFEFQKLWNQLLRMQIGAYGYYYWGDEAGGQVVRQDVDRLLSIIDEKLKGPVGAEPASVTRSRRELLVDLRGWVSRFVRQMDPTHAGPRAPADLNLVFRFSEVRTFQLRLFAHSEIEIARVAEEIGLVQESVMSLTRTYTTVFLFFAVIAWGLAVLIGRVILRPVDVLLDGYRKMGQGDFEYRIRDVRRDEFGELQNGFNRMAEAVEKHEHELSQARDSVEVLAYKMQNYNEDLEREVARRTTELHRALQDLKETDRIKSEFIANISHELRTPLNSIIGFSKVILKGIDGPVNEKQKEDLNLIHQSGKHLLNLIAQVLDFSKLEAGRFTLDKEMVDLKQLGEEAILSVKPLVKKNRVRLMMDHASDVPAISADPVRLQQVMINLLGNAAKFTEKGWIRLEIRRWTAGDDESPAEPVAFDEGVLIRVQDTGIGISEKDRKMVFQKFRQVDGSSARIYGGTGLGLAITRELVTLHGGHIWFTGGLEIGSTFRVLLPAESKRTVDREATG